MFTQMKFVFIAVVALTIILLPIACQAQSERSANTMETQVDFDAAVALLNSKKPNRFDGLCKLIEYSWTEVFRSGSMFFLVPNQKQIAHGAEIVRKYADDKTALIACLNAQSSPLARQWAIRCIGQAKNLSLVPQLIKVASSDSDSGVRAKAIEQLQQINPKMPLPQYLDQQEKDPYVLEKVYKNELDLNRLLIGLLQDSDEKVRITALGFIGQDAQRDYINMVPCHSFNGAVFNAVVARLSAPSVGERKSAVYALERVKFYDPDVIRQTYLKLAQDSDPDLRWRAAYGLVEQRGRPDVDKVFQQLINDPSSLVRYMTISRLPDAKNYAQQLSELVKDQEVAGLVGQGTVMTTSAAAANWTKDNKFSQQFLLPDTDGVKIEWSKAEKLLDHIESIRDYIHNLNVETQQKTNQLLSEATALSSHENGAQQALDKIEPLYREAIEQRNDRLRKSLAGFQFPVLLIEPHSDDHGKNWANGKLGLAIDLKAQPGKLLPSKEKCYTDLTIDPANSFVYASNGKELDSISPTGVVRQISSATDSLFQGQITGIAFDTKRKKLWASGRHIGLYDPRTESWTKLIEKDKRSGTPRDMTFSKLKFYSEPEDVFYAEDITYGRNAMVRVSAETGQMLESGLMPIALPMWEQVVVKGNNLICISKIDPWLPQQNKQTISVIDKRDGTILYQDTFYLTPKP